MSWGEREGRRKKGTTATCSAPRGSGVEDLALSCLGDRERGKKGKRILCCPLCTARRFKGENPLALLSALRSPGGGRCNKKGGRRKKDGSLDL